MTVDGGEEEADLQDSISAYLADQVELDRERTSDLTYELPPVKSPDTWDLSPFPESTRAPDQKEERKRRRKHTLKRLSYATSPSLSHECLKDECENARSNAVKRTEESKTNSDYQDYTMYGDMGQSTPQPLHDDAQSGNDHQRKRLSHKRSRIRNTASNVAKSFAPLAGTSVILSNRQPGTMEEHIVPRALPPGLPPEILAKIKAMKAKSRHGALKQGLPKASPPGTSPVSSIPKRPSFPVKMPGASLAGSSPGVPPEIQAIINKQKKKARKHFRGRWRSKNTGANSRTAEMLPQISETSNTLTQPASPKVSPIMPTGVAGGVPPSIPGGMPPIVPPGTPARAPPSMPAAMPAPIPAPMPPPAPPPEPGPAPGLPPSLPAGLAAAGGGPAGPLPAPIEDFSWLKASLKAAVDKEAVSAALQKAVAKLPAPARLLGAVRPRLAAAFSVQYSTADCSEVAAFKGAFPGQATSSVCLICQPGGRAGPAVMGAAGPPGAPVVPPEVQTVMNQAEAQQEAQATGEVPAGGAHGMPLGMLPGVSPGRPAGRKRRQFYTRPRRSRVILAAARRWRRQTGRCVPICELRDIRVKCTSSEKSHAMTVVGTAVVSPASSFHKCSAKCEREWELLLQFAAAEKLRAYFLSGQEVQTGAAASRPLADSWQVERVLRCGPGGLTLQQGLCYPAGNWALRAVLAAQNSGAAGLAALAGAGGLALIITFGLLFYFRVLKLPAFCERLWKGGGKRKTGGGGGGGGGGGEKLGEGGAGTVEFVDEPPPPPPPAG